MMTSQHLSDLIRQFEEIKAASLHEDEHGFITLEINNTFAQAKIALHGAHLFHFQTHHRPPLLWLSEMAHFEHSKAIRGGIPICWPWFGEHPDNTALPNHGFARTSLWQLETVTTHQDDSHTVILGLYDDAKTRKLWPHRFSLHLSITIADTLSVSLIMKNLDTAPFSISAALHTYFTISDIGKVSISGLEQCRYLDQLDERTQTQEGAITFSNETDRIYLNTPETLQLHDGTRTLTITQQGSQSSVIWNPWVEKTRRFSDMCDDAYRSMLCIETANVLQDMRTLQAGEEHRLCATYRSSFS